MKRHLSFFVLLVAAGCGGGGSSGSSSTIAPASSNTTPAPVGSGTGTSPTTSSTIAAPVSASLTLNEFAAFKELSSIADLQIPGGTVLKNKAFVLEDKGFVHVLDLSGAKPALDRIIPLDAASPFSSGTSAGSLTLVDDHNAVATASGKEAVYIFDPSTAMTAQDVTKVDLSTMTVTFTTTPTNSKGVSAPNPMPLTFTASAIISKGRLFIASSNLDASYNYNPGTVVAFTWDPVTKTLGQGSLIVTSSFNPTRITRWRDASGAEALLVVNGGANGTSPSSVDVIDPARAAIVATIPLGNVSAAGAVAITPDGKRGYVASSSAAEVYELDLSNLATVVVSATVQSLASSVKGPIKLPASTGLNFVAGLAVSNSGSYLYASNFNTSSLAVVDLKARSVAGTLSGFQRGGDPTKFQCNASALAVRPGVPGVDFQGPPCFVATIGLDAADQTVPSVTSALDGVSFDKN